MFKTTADHVEPGYFIEFEVIPGIMDEVLVIRVYEGTEDHKVHFITDDGRDVPFREDDVVWVI